MDDKNCFITGLLWQEYNHALRGNIPIWDISNEATILYIDIPQENDFWINEDGDERWTITIVLVCKSKSEENTRYGFVFKCYARSYNEVSEVTSFLRLGHHRITIEGWDEVSNRWLDIDLHINLGGRDGFTCISIIDSFYV
jgi:hypothetical protein